MNRTVKIAVCCLMLLAVVASCNKEKDFNIYTDADPTMIIYGFLNPESDTNFLKITKSFNGDATVGTQDYALNNYDYKLYVRLINRKEPKDSIAFDTTSVYKPWDGTSPFYSGRRQLVYFTTEKLTAGDEYDLYVRDRSGNEVTTRLKLVSDIDITWPYNSKISFLGSYNSDIRWKRKDLSQPWAPYYEVTGFFNYRQLNPGENDTTDHSVKWYLGNGTPESLYMDNSYLHIYYTPDTFFDIMLADDNIKNNSPAGVRRWYKNFTIVVSAAGEELYNYTVISSSESVIQDSPEYTNISGGLGLVSSKINVEKSYSIAIETMNQIYRDYPEWGFVTEPQK